MRADLKFRIRSGSVAGGLHRALLRKERNSNFNNSLIYSFTFFTVFQGIIALVIINMFFCNLLFTSTFYFCA